MASLQLRSIFLSFLTVTSYSIPFEPFASERWSSHGSLHMNMNLHFTACFVSRQPTSHYDLKARNIHLQRLPKYTVLSEKSAEKDTNQGDVKVSKKKSSSSYQFGDLTKSVLKKVTKNEDYQWGDISRSLDEKAKSKVNQWTGKDEYEFGDISRMLDKEAKEKVTKWTGKEKYEVGDISKLILSRVYSEVKNHEWSMGDYIILFKILLSFGMGLTPVSGVLPMKFLIEMLEYSAAADVGNQLVSVIIGEIDKKAKEMITGNATYKMGDISKQILSEYSKQALGKYLVSLQEGSKKDDAVAVIDTTSDSGGKDGPTDPKITPTNQYLNTLRDSKVVLKEDFDETVWKELTLWEEKNMKRPQ